MNALTVVWRVVVKFMGVAEGVADRIIIFKGGPERERATCCSVLRQCDLGAKKTMNYVCFWKDNTAKDTRVLFGLVLSRFYFDKNGGGCILSDGRICRIGLWKAHYNLLQNQNFCHIYAF